METWVFLIAKLLNLRNYAYQLWTFAKSCSDQQLSDVSEYEVDLESFPTDRKRGQIFRRKTKYTNSSQLCWLTLGRLRVRSMRLGWLVLRYVYRSFRWLYLIHSYTIQLMKVCSQDDSLWYKRITLPVLSLYYPQAWSCSKGWERGYNEPFYL
jgi:hypothetical protein